MNLSEKGAAFVRGHEGFVPRWYLDPVNEPTLGSGFTWASASFREWWSRNRPGQTFGPGATITREENDKALIFMFAAEYGKAVDQFLGKTVKQHVFDGMASPVFNMGPGSLKWKWAAAAKAGDLETAARLLQTVGTTGKGTGKKLPGLVKRRKDEADLLLHGDYTIGDVSRDPMADGVLVRGERGAAVTDLQTQLQRLGYYDGVLDGRFGYGTEAAVLAFQRAHDLTADGKAGEKTLEALAAAQQPKATGPLKTEAAPKETAPQPQQPQRTGNPLKLIVALGVAAALLIGTALVDAWHALGVFVAWLFGAG